MKFSLKISPVKTDRYWMSVVPLLKFSQLPRLKIQKKNMSNNVMDGNHSMSFNLTRQFFVVCRRTMPYNVSQLGEVADFEALTSFLVRKFF